jgi:hypothetical protein
VYIDVFFKSSQCHCSPLYTSALSLLSAIKAMLLSMLFIQPFVGHSAIACPLTWFDRSLAGLISLDLGDDFPNLLAVGTNNISWVGHHFCAIRSESGVSCTGNLLILDGRISTLRFGCWNGVILPNNIC